MKVEDITAQTVIDRVIADTGFSPWGRLLFPADSGLLARSDTRHFAVEMVQPYRCSKDGRDHPLF